MSVDPKGTHATSQSAQLNQRKHVGTDDDRCCLRRDRVWDIPQAWNHYRDSLHIPNPPLVVLPLLALSLTTSDWCERASKTVLPLLALSLTTSDWCERASKTVLPLLAFSL